MSPSPQARFTAALAPAPLLLLLSLLALSAGRGGHAQQMLLLSRNIRPVPPYNWTCAALSETDPLMANVLNVLQAFTIPAANIGYQLDLAPSPSFFYPPLVAAPATTTTTTNTTIRPLRRLSGFRNSYQAPLRIGGITKVFTLAVYRQRLARHLNDSVYTLWSQSVALLPARPMDPRFLEITVSHLLDHTSGLDIRRIGYDPVFFQDAGVEQQLHAMVENMTLRTAPGTRVRVFNFGYTILARLAEAITRRPFLSLIRSILPPETPIYQASDSVPVPTTAVPNPGAPEPGIYYLQSQETAVNVSSLNGVGNMVTNIATLAWFGTHYWIAGPNAGSSIADFPAAPGTLYIIASSLPGTTALLSQYVTPGGHIGSFCVLLNTCVRKSHLLFSDLSHAVAQFQTEKFSSYR
jgi:hypothetical protein